MVVVPFPRPTSRSVPNHSVPEILIEMISAVQVLGEPVTAREIQNILTIGSINICIKDLNDQLDKYCLPQSVFDQQVIFRKIPIDHQEYWAFTSEFRTILNQVCLEPAFRHSL